MTHKWPCPSIWDFSFSFFFFSTNYIIIEMSKSRKINKLVNLKGLVNLLSFVELPEMDGSRI
jgi:hypothetical protein